jgi:4-amino-4-deoxy-L-arabinose transferase-like glycosyltransferase
MAVRPISPRDYPPVPPPGSDVDDPTEERSWWDESDDPGADEERDRFDDGRSERPPGRPSRWIDVVIVAGLVLLACTITVLGVERAPSLSAFDESTHIDYTWRVAHGTLPYAGSEITPQVLSDWSCRSQDNLADSLPPCGEPHPAAEYPAKGENYNFTHPPTYYLITAGVTKAADLLPFDVSFISAARLTGAAWLAAALVGLYLLLRRWWAPRLLAVSAAVLLAAVPSIAHASSVVTNDAAAALAGVLGLWLVTRVAVQEKYGWLLPTVVTAFIASTKVMNAIALLAAAAVVAVLAVGAARSGDRRRALRLGGLATGVVVATLVVWVAWSTFQKTRAVDGWISPIRSAHTAPVEGLPFDEWLPNMFSTFGIVQDYWLQNALTGFAIVALVGLLKVVMTAAPFANIAAFAPGDVRRLVGWAALIGCLAVPLVVQLQTYAGDGYYFHTLTSRYGLSLLPLCIAAFALVAQSRQWRVAPALLGGVSIGALLLSFAGVL